MLQAFSHANARRQKIRAVTCRADDHDIVSAESGENQDWFNCVI